MKYYVSLILALCCACNAHAMEHDPFNIFKAENKKLLAQLKDTSDTQENVATCLAGYNLSVETIDKLPDTPLKAMNLDILKKAKEEWLERYSSLDGAASEQVPTFNLASQQPDQGALEQIWQDYLQDPGHLMEVRSKAYEVASQRPNNFKKFPNKQLWNQARSNCKSVMFQEPLPPISTWALRGTVKKANEVLYQRMLDETKKLKDAYLEQIIS